MGPQDHCVEGSKIDEIEVKKEKRFEGHCAIIFLGQLVNSIMQKRF